MIHKVNEPILVRYLSLNKDEGLTDLTLIATNPSFIDIDPIPMQSIGNGLYQASFTPSTVGWYSVRVCCTSQPANTYSKTYCVGEQYEWVQLNALTNKVIISLCIAIGIATTVISLVIWFRP